MSYSQLLTLLALTWVGAACPVIADDGAPTRPTMAGTIDAILQAVEKEDQAALKVLGGKDSPDPWIVVETLCRRNAHAAAALFATAGVRPATERLAGYVEEHRKHAADPAADVWHQVVLAAQQRAWAHIVRLCEAVEDGWLSVTRTRLLEFHGRCLVRMGRRSDAVPVLGQAAQSAEALGWIQRAASLRTAVAEQCYALGDAPAAFGHLKRAVAHFKVAANRKLLAGTLLNLGLLQDAVGKHREARATLQAAYDAAKALGNEQWMANALGNIGNAHFALGEFSQALEHYKQALALNERTGNARETTRYIGSIGRAFLQLGDVRRATVHLYRALKLAEASKDASQISDSLQSIGILDNRMGHYARALKHRLRALEFAERTKNQRRIAEALHEIGTTHWHVGELARANDHFERAMRGYKATGHKVGLSRVLISLGLVQRDLKRMDQALAYIKQAQVVMRERASQHGTARVLGILADFREQQGKYVLAIERAREALPLYEAVGDRSGVAETHARIGWLDVLLDERKRGLESLKLAMRLSRPLRHRNLYVWCLQRLAEAYLKGGENERALTRAREALDEIEYFVEGLAEEQGALARRQYTRVFEIGAVAAARLIDVAEVVTFLESGRAGGLLESLTSRQSLRWAEVPEHVRLDEAAARSAVTQAREAYLDALAGDKRKPRLEARKRLRAAIDRLRDVSGRIERATKGPMAGPYPVAESLERIQSHIKPEEALILYGLALDEALAVVVTRTAARLVPLGSVGALQARCEAVSVTDASIDLATPIEALRKSLVQPLGLDKSVRRVLVCPQGPLCFLPFSILFPQEVAYTPSGTTHVMLQAYPAQDGRRVLALGDPDYDSRETDHLFYTGRKLSELPRTASEVRAIGDQLLIGAQATEARLRAALKEEPRWRAVHFACHGFVDAERPALCALALTPSDEDDGLLTSLEVLTMDIPADLAMLAACDTARGKIIDGEGILGLTRSFMLAGAPRVICSLWKVDDDATEVLMRRFYELWNPEASSGRKPVSAAAALRAAQDHVRSQKRWAHPYYWAAWVLWGLPD